MPLLPFLKFWTFPFISEHSPTIKTPLATFQTPFFTQTVKLSEFTVHCPSSSEPAVFKLILCVYMLFTQPWSCFTPRFQLLISYLLFETTLAFSLPNHSHKVSLSQSFSIFTIFVIFFSFCHLGIQKSKPQPIYFVFQTLKHNQTGHRVSPTSEAQIYDEPSHILNQIG